MLKFAKNSLLSIPQFSFTKDIRPLRKWRIFAGDEVCVISGPEKGKVGKIIRVYRKEEKVLVEGINKIIKKQEYDSENAMKGDDMEEHQPMYSHMVNLWDPKLKRPTKIKIGYLENGEMVRICKRSGVILEKPKYDHLRYGERVKNKVDGPLDTPGTLVVAQTYKGENFDKIREEFEKFVNEKEKIEQLLVFKS